MFVVDGKRNEKETYQAHACIAGAANQWNSLHTMVSRLPPLIRKALLLRGAAVWLFARFMAAAVISAAKAQGLDVGVALVPVWVLATAPSLVLIDLHRRKETTLLHNLGVTTPFAVTVGSMPSVVFEAAIAAVGLLR